MTAGRIRMGLLLGDLIGQALDGVGGKPVRLLIGLLGAAVGIGALVVTVGLGQTATGQLSSRFDSAAALHAEVAPTTASGSDGKERAQATLPVDSVSRVTSLAGVQAAALVTTLPDPAPSVRTADIHDPSQPPPASPPVMAADADLLGATGGVLGAGRFFDAGHEARHDRVAVLGAKAAAELGVGSLQSRPSVFIGDHAYTVIGILDSVTVQRPLLEAVIVPSTTARRDLGLRMPDTLVLQVAPGASAIVARQVPIALDSGDPGSFTVAAPPSGGLEGAVRHDLDLVFFAVALIILAAGALGVANVTMLSVTERRAEIGLRRALGTPRSLVAAQFVIESLIVGIIGGVIGAAAGVLVVVAVSSAQAWTPVLDVGVVVAAVGAGGVLGMLAGGFPALRAARVEPIEALRS
ncbi:ABC transporter permease [Herbiconiux solani]|uniref:ABC transporter permease n=1 Tax=Herbiconiux solani TaxID=661329 RepID=UPI00082492F4|nr:ABC transporter permease [Herbiconiux solani]